MAQRQTPRGAAVSEDLAASLGVVVGLAAEGKIASSLGRVAAGGGDSAGAEQVARALVTDGARALLSFGLAGGLDPDLRPGRLIVPRAVLLGLDESGRPDDAAGDVGRCAANPAMVESLGGATCELILGASEVVSDAATKRRLREQTGASAIDLESGAVARIARERGLPFAVLRAICDPAERSLPPAALIALGGSGEIQILKLLASVAANPSQIPGLIALARDAAAARRALIRRVAELRDRLPLV